MDLTTFDRIIINTSAGEQCEDGNVDAGDGCSATCMSDESCGNGVVDDGEACDDGNQSSGDGCLDERGERNQVRGAMRVVRRRGRAAAARQRQLQRPR